MARLYPSPTADEVRAARLAAGMTQDAAAETVLSARRAWQDWESGARRMHPGLWQLFLISPKR